jgi:hypothetical protein
MIISKNTGPRMLAKLAQAFKILREDFSSLKGDFQRLEKVRPIVTHGKDGLSPKIEDIVAAVLESMPAAIDGISPDPQAIAELAAKLIPEATPGRDAIPPTVRDVADVVLAQIKKPADGISPDPAIIAAQAAKLIKVPKDGVSPTPEAVARAMPTPQRGKTGAPGKNGVSITDVKLTNNELFVFLDGKKKSAGTVKLPAVTAPFRPGADSGGGGGARIVNPRPLYFESNSVSSENFSPGPKTTIPGLALVTSGTSTPYEVQSQIQFTALPQLATPVVLADLIALTAELNALTGGVAHGADFGDGETLQAGVYDVASASTHEGLLTFDAQGDADAVFVIRVDGAEAISTLATTALANGAQTCNIFWVVVGALTIGAGCNLKGTYIGSGAVGVDTLTLDGRILTPTGALALTAGNITKPVGISATITLGYVESIILFTGAGAVSNTIVTSGIVGSVASNLGAVTGFPNLDGIIYTSNSKVIDVVFVIESNDIAIPSSSTRFTLVEDAQNREFFNRVSLSGLSLRAEQQDIAIKLTVALGTIRIGNRNILAFEL